VLYLYFRALEGRWVVAEVVAPESNVLARSGGPEMTSAPWEVGGDWGLHPAAVVTRCQNR
jgi:hypothetical protein